MPNRIVWLAALFLFATGCDGITPTLVRVRVQAQGVDREWDFTPQYRTIYPNGRDCDRVGCRQAEVVADLTQ